MDKNESRSLKSSSPSSGQRLHEKGYFHDKPIGSNTARTQDPWIKRQTT